MGSPLVKGCLLVKMGFPTVILLASLALFANADECTNTSLCPDGWTQVDGSCFQFNTALEDYETATQRCKSGGAKLFEPQTAAECLAVRQMAENAGLSNFWWVSMTLLKKDLGCMPPLDPHWPSMIGTLVSPTITTMAMMLVVKIALKYTQVVS